METKDTLRKNQNYQKEIYRADNVSFSANASKKLKEISNVDMTTFTVCMAKTQYSFRQTPQKSVLLQSRQH